MATIPLLAETHTAVLVKLLIYNDNNAIYILYSVCNMFLRSDHGSVRALHLQELDDEGWAAGYNLWREVTERAVLNTHDG